MILIKREGYQETLAYNELGDAIRMIEKLLMEGIVGALVIRQTNWTPVSAEVEKGREADVS